MLVNESIRVNTRNGLPQRLQWQNRTYQTRKLLDFWIHQTRWWGREEKRVYFRLETDRGVLEVYRASESPRNTAAPDHARTLESNRTDSAEFDASNSQPAASRKPPLPVEGDTHTREHRRTDAVYGPNALSGSDVRTAGEARRSPDRAQVRRVRWVLSKILD